EGYGDQSFPSEAPEEVTEAMLASILHDKFLGRYQYLKDAQRWYRYANGVWKDDLHNSVRKEALEILKNYVDSRIEALKFSDAAYMDAKKQYEALIRLKKQVGSRRKVDDILILTQDLIPGELAEFDRDPLLINLKN